VTQRVFATPDDYTTYAEEAFGGTNELLQKRLRAASIEVEKLTRMSIYDIDDDGYPTVQATADAFTEATVAIVEHWVDTDDPRGTDAIQGAVKIGSVSLGTTSSSTDTLTAREKLARRIGDKALDILTNAGLIGSAVAHN
jgi:hypothetical protein